MISPHIYLSAAHCGGPLIDVRFYHIDEDAPGPAAQYQQKSQVYRGRPLPWQSFIHPTGTQKGDSQLFWLEDGSDGVPPGIKYGYIELSPTASALGEQLYSFWFNPQDGLADTVLYSDGSVTRLGTQPIGDPPLYFAHSDLFTLGGASGSSVLRASDQRIMGVTATGGGNLRTTADMAHLLTGYDGEVDQVLDVVEYDLMLTSTRLNFQRLRFDTPVQRAQWRTIDISGSVGNGPSLNDALVGGSMIGPAAYRAYWNSPWMPEDQTKWVPTLQLETFEDGQLNLPGISASAGSVLGPGPNTDSVDQDDGNLDNFSGTGGHSFFSANGSAGIRFTFNPAVLGRLPTRAGSSGPTVTARRRSRPTTVRVRCSGGSARSSSTMEHSTAARAKTVSSPLRTRAASVRSRSATARAASKSIICTLAPVRSFSLTRRRDATPCGTPMPASPPMPVIASVWSSMA